MGRIKVPDNYVEITYGQGESYGSGQTEVLKWVGAGVLTAAVIGGTIIGVHRCRNGYWIWDRTTARAVAGMGPEERKDYLSMNSAERKTYLTLGAEERKVARMVKRHPNWKPNMGFDGDLDP